MGLDVLMGVFGVEKGFADCFVHQTGCGVDVVGYRWEEYLFISPTCLFSVTRLGSLYIRI